ncbi:tyrosine-type recombinase/integrase [Bacteroides sp.]|uniref:tyrosine-type recombinase/integrase n=1 Tax=Bacteroides sp. TaxID=29523 RepID=UPI003AB61DB9
MDNEELKNHAEAIELSFYMSVVIEDLKRDGKFPAVHIYACTLRSFEAFAASGGSGSGLLLHEVFTPGRLKAYENWLLAVRELSLNTVSTYMRTLQAVYHRWMPFGSPGCNPKLFDDVYTKVVSQTKRALTGQQVNKLMSADIETLPEDLKRVFAYFFLMLFFRGMPFIDLAHLRKRDVQSGNIIYRRHKTGKQMTVHIPREAAGLLKEFRDKNPQSVYLFPILDVRVHGARELYECYQTALCRFNKSLKRLMRLLLPGVAVSSYTARHTWATIAYHIGVPVGVICQSLGHSSIRVTETYLKPFENKWVDRANRKVISTALKRGRGNSMLCSTL